MNKFHKFGNDGFTAQFDRNHARGVALIATVAPTQVSTVCEEIILETAGKLATVTPIRPELEWLMHDVSSTDYAVIARGDA